MKKLLYSLIALFLVVGIKATDPPKKKKIYPITKQSMSLEWYQEQMNLWEKEVEINAKDTDAWLNFLIPPQNTST